MRTILPAIIVTTLGFGGCSQPGIRASFESGSPAERTLAAAQTVRSGDVSKIPHLITMLDSADPAQRMIAADALERLTGRTFDYFFADPEPRRREAITRWRAWHESDGTSPGGAS